MRSFICLVSVIFTLTVSAQAFGQSHDEIVERLLQMRSQIPDSVGQISVRRAGGLQALALGKDISAVENLEHKIVRNPVLWESYVKEVRRIGKAWGRVLPGVAVAALSPLLFTFDASLNGAEAATTNLFHDTLGIDVVADQTLGPYFLSSPERFQEFLNLPESQAMMYVKQSPALRQAVFILTDQMAKQESALSNK